MTPENIIRIINVTLCLPGIIGSTMWMLYAHRHGRDWRAVFLYTLPLTFWLLNIMVYTLLLLIWPENFSIQVILIWDSVIRTIAICVMSFFVLAVGFDWQQVGKFTLGKDN